MPDRAALVTGASSGIGLAIADLLGAEGYGLTVAARRPEKLSAAVEQLRGSGYDVEEVAANMATEEDIQRVVAAYRDRFGRLDVLVNNAAEAVRFLLRTSPACRVPEIVFERPGESI
jgi:NAD(P)-dependent dehydrogenase (short-subunit alcohol dehydrogenase family)